MAKNALKGSLPSVGQVLKEIERGIRDFFKGDSPPRVKDNGSGTAKAKKSGVDAKGKLDTKKIAAAVMASAAIASGIVVGVGVEAEVPFKGGSENRPSASINGEGTLTVADGVDIYARTNTIIHDNNRRFGDTSADIGIRARLGSGVDIGAFGGMGHDGRPRAGVGITIRW